MSYRHNSYVNTYSTQDMGKYNSTNKNEQLNWFILFLLIILFFYLLGINLRIFKYKLLLCKNYKNLGLHTYNGKLIIWYQPKLVLYIFIICEYKYDKKGSNGGIGIIFSQVSSKITLHSYRCTHIQM